MENTNNIVGICIGKKHTGKTTLLKSLLPLNDKPHFVCDIAEQFNGVIWYNFEALINDVENNKQNIRGRINVCRFANFSEYNWLFRLVQTHRNCVIVIDEVQLYIKYGKLDNTLYEIMTVGRNYGIDILMATVSPSYIDKTIFKQSDFIVCFNVQDKYDIQYLAGNSLIGERAIELPNLSVDKHEKIVFGDTGNLMIGGTTNTKTESKAITQESEIT